MRLLICYGTRPEWIKIKPIIVKIKGIIDYKILFTGQQEDIGKFDYDYNICIDYNSENRLNNIICSILMNFKNYNFSHVLIQGDTATAYAIALSSFNNNKKIIHLEAGLRTYDIENPYPEEAYRQMISRISDINFCPTNENKNNLINEKVKGEIYVVGNTIIDSLVKFKSISYNDNILITLHRRENHIIINDWFLAIKEISEQYKNLNFILFKHPNPYVSSHYNIFKNSNVNIVEPINHDEMIDYISNCKLIISDSGGLQEEASYFNKKIIVCRKITERPETIGTNSFLCDTPKDLNSIFKNHIFNYKVNNNCPYGDGYSSDKILEILKKIK